MQAPDLFIGVVSHPATRFPESQGPDGLAMGIAARIPGSDVLINTENASGAITVTPGMVQRALSAELRLEWRWNDYLGGPLGYQGTLLLRWVKRGWRRLRPPGEGVIRRLLNIEASHRHLWAAGLASEAPWVLVLEDDGHADDLDDLAAGIRSLMAEPDAPAYVNLSRSFGAGALRVQSLLTPAEAAWGGREDRSILAADRPITNTVCAMLYSRSFLEQLIPLWDSLPMDPVIPIDWKLNDCLMRMSYAGSFPVRGCWFVEPGPITQGSMHETGILAA